MRESATAVDFRFEGASFTGEADVSSATPVAAVMLVWEEGSLQRRSFLVLFVPGALAEPWGPPSEFAQATLHASASRLVKRSLRMSALDTTPTGGSS